MIPSNYDDFWEILSTIWFWSIFFSRGHAITSPRFNGLIRDVKKDSDIVHGSKFFPFSVRYEDRQRHYFWSTSRIERNSLWRFHVSTTWNNGSRFEHGLLGCSTTFSSWSFAMVATGLHFCATFMHTKVCREKRRRNRKANFEFFSNAELLQTFNYYHELSGVHIEEVIRTQVQQEVSQTFAAIGK